MKLSRSLVLLAAGLAWAVGGQAVRADIYKLVDADGAVTYSNIPPKDRNRIAEVFVSDSPPSGAAMPGTVTRQSEEIRILADRVDHLTRLLEDERRFNAPQQAAYPQYAPPPPPMGDGWNSDWGYGWNGWWNGSWFGPPFFASAPVVVVGGHNRFPHFHKFNHFPRGGHFGPGVVGSHPGFRSGPGFQSTAPRIPAFRAGFPAARAGFPASRAGSRMR